MHHPAAGARGRGYGARATTHGEGGGGRVHADAEQGAGNGLSRTEQVVEGSGQVGWALGTPCLLYGAVIVSAPFFGETPAPEQMQNAEMLLYAGVACGLLLPIIGMVVAGLARRRAATWLFAAALAVTVAVFGYVAGR